MLIDSYLQRAEQIRVQEFWSRAQLAKKIGITYSTLLRINTDSKKCLPRTAQKVKAFVEKYSVQQ